MKYTIPLFITLIYTAHSTYPREEEEKRYNTQGIRPLFDQSDKAGMKRFNQFHERAVNYIRGNLLSQAQSALEYKQQLILAQIDLKQLYNQCKEKGPENYLTELIQQHEKNKEILVSQAVQTIENAAQKQDIKSFEMEQAMTALQRKSDLIKELEQIQNRNRIIVIEDVNGDNYDAASSSDSESAID